MDINIYIFIIEMEINMFDDNIEERYSLAIERISEINKDDELSDYGAGMYRRLYCLWISSRMI